MWLLLKWRCSLGGGHLKQDDVIDRYDHDNSLMAELKTTLLNRQLDVFPTTASWEYSAMAADLTNFRTA
jgi:hypothetical protein